MTDTTRFLVTLAETIAEAYVRHTRPRAVLLTGSAATGESDAYSDIDLIVYHGEIPPDGDLAEARATVGVDEILFVGGDRDQGRYQETYLTQGIECQLGHVTTDVWEREMARVLENFDVTSGTQKAIDGLLHGIPLHGDVLIRRWQERASAYPDSLARAMVLAHLRFVPVWRFQDRLRTRDATLWYHQILVDASLDLLGVLAGLNRLYFSSFQFKRMHAFVVRMRIAPDNLADRLDHLFEYEPATAIADLERLVAETVDLVQAHLPDVEVGQVRQWLGARERPWVMSQQKCWARRTVDVVAAGSLCYPFRYPRAVRTETIVLSEQSRCAT